MFNLNLCNSQLHALQGNVVSGTVSPEVVMFPYFGHSNVIFWTLEVEETKWPQNQ